MFHDVLDKKSHLDYKNNNQAKNRSFPKGLTHDFCQKIQNFLFLVFGQNESRNSISRCSRREKKYFTVKKTF